MQIKKLIPCVAALSMAMTASAMAGGPLANCESGVPFAWPNGGENIPFNPDQGNLGPLTNAQATALVAASFQVWDDVPTSTASYAEGASLAVDVDITNFGPFLNPPAPDGVSPIVYDDDGAIFTLLFGAGSGILGFAGPDFGDTTTCEILEGSSFLNGPAFTDATAAFDVMVHEFGHYSNLAHTVVNGQVLGFGDATGASPSNAPFGLPASAVELVETMYPFYFGPGSGTQTLHRDDVASLSTIYPDPSFAATTATISGTILATNATTRLNGVNVIARNLADPFDDAVSAISGDFTDSGSQADPVVGTYTIEGLTPDADYAVFVDQIVAGGFSTPPITLPAAEEFYNGAGEGPFGDDPADFTPVSAAAGGVAAGIDIIFNGFGPGDPIPLGDDDFELVSLPFTYRICGMDFDDVYINSNGNLTFGSGDTDFSESPGELLSDQPRIAGLWDDLSPNQGGTVFFTQSTNTFTVHFENVPEFFASTENSFSMTLHRSSDHVDLNYGDLAATDGIAGVSCGGAVTSGAETASDLSAFGSSTINLHNSPAVYEVFNGANPNDLSNSGLGFNGTTNYNDNWAEKNDSLGKARSINLPFDSFDIPRYTEIEPTGGDVDFYRFTADGNTTLVAEIVSGQLDSVLGLFDSAGNLIAADDDGGSGLLSQIQFPLATGGTYYLAVSTFPDFGFDGSGGSGGRYVLDVRTMDGFLIALGDDDSAEVPLPFSFPYQGGSYTSVFVNSNGNLTFGSGDTDFSESVAELLNDQPRIAAVWDDLSPNNGGTVVGEFDGDSVTITFDSVPEFFSTGSNSFAVTLSGTGEVAIVYGNVDSSDSIAGVSPGGGAGDPGEVDLSAAGALSANGVTYEQFTGDFDLDGSVLIFNP